MPPTPDRSCISAIGLGSASTAILVPMMDAFIVNVALPTIAAELPAGATALELVIAGYGIAFTVLLVLGGRLGDRFGRRRILLLGLLGFTASSLLCGLAGNAPMLIAARLAQGAFAALIPPQVLGTIQAATSGPRRTRAISRYSAVTGISATLGLVLGGLLLHLDLGGTSWRSLFLINIPIGLVLAVLIRRTVPETRAGEPAGIDGKGTVLLAGLLLALLVPFSFGQGSGWPIWSLLLLVAAVPLALVLWRTERAVTATGRLALLPPALLGEPRVYRGLLLLAPFLAAGAGFLYAFPITVQGGLGLSPLASGLAVAPMSLAFFLGSYGVPRLVRVLGPRILGAGTLVQAGGLALVACVFWFWSGQPPGLAIVPGMILIGLGQALAISGTNTLVLAAVPTELGGVGGGILITAQQAAMALGTALLGGVYTESAHSNGFVPAFVLVMIVQIGIALVIAALILIRHPRDVTHLITEES
ncbi:MFS transporter [Sciscionella sediminilitoris]|uniref:MFS transporter n=1 Tax=Sciscionella sediminilitoris TaxID=1445613 RepID=UPI00055C6A34|nr:MFS transporter [Sciscionella sp. SE31]